MAKVYLYQFVIFYFFFIKNYLNIMIIVFKWTWNFPRLVYYLDKSGKLQQTIKCFLTILKNVALIRRLIDSDIKLMLIKISSRRQIIKGLRLTNNW